MPVPLVVSCPNKVVILRCTYLPFGSYTTSFRTKLVLFGNFSSQRSAHLCFGINRGHLNRLHYVTRPLCLVESHKCGRALCLPYNYSLH